LYRCTGGGGGGGGGGRSGRGVVSGGGSGLGVVMVPAAAREPPAANPRSTRQTIRTGRRQRPEPHLVRAADRTIDPFLKSAVSAAASPTPQHDEDQTDAGLCCATVGAPKFAPSSSSPKVRLARCLSIRPCQSAQGGVAFSVLTSLEGCSHLRLKVANAMDGHHGSKGDRSR
jgi:hypothetical protein